MKNSLRRFISLVLLTYAFSLAAAVPGTISYQGYLTDSLGAPVDGAQSVTFNLYNSSSALIWTETISVMVASGVFEATLGAATPLPDPLINGTSLGLKFGGNAEMTPRQALNSAPFAIHAQTTEKDTLNSLSCSADQIAKWSGTSWACSDDLPATAVTTDTTQTISGTKTFENAPKLIGGADIGAAQDFGRLNIYGEIEMNNHSTASRFLDIVGGTGNNALFQAGSGGDIYFNDHLHLSNESGTQNHDLFVDNIETDGIEVYGGVIDIRTGQSVGGASGGTISYDSSYGIRINPSSDVGDTVNIIDNLRVGDDIFATDNVFIDDDLEVTGSALKTGGGQWGTLSDKRLKQNVSKMDGVSALKRIESLKPVQFEWINPEEHGDRNHEFGFIAQELEQIFPSWVQTSKVKGKDSDLVDGSAKSINLPNEFNAYLVSAIKELAAQNRMLKELVCQDHPKKALCQ